MRNLTFLFIFILGCIIDVPSNEIDLSSGERIETSESSSSSSSSEGEEPQEDFSLDLMYDPDSRSVPRCQKIDFLFVIDNSGSMGDNQDLLIANFPTFVDGILEFETLEDFQVGVITTDYSKNNIVECQTLGGLVAQTGGGYYGNDPGQTCIPYASDRNYMTQEDDLIEKFSCAAKVGVDGDGNERPIEALIQASENWIRQPGNCNEGFLRKSALLVIIFITDEDQVINQYGGISVEEQLLDWRDHLLWLRDGPETDIVMLGLVSNSNCAEQESYESTNLINFIHMFSYGQVAGICESSYKQFYRDALNQVKNSCELESVPVP